MYRGGGERFDTVLWINKVMKKVKAPEASSRKAKAGTRGTVREAKTSVRALGCPYLVILNGRMTTLTAKSPAISKVWGRLIGRLFFA